MRWLLLLGLLTATISPARAEGDIYHLWIGTGVLVQDPLRESGFNTGAASVFGTFYWNLMVAAHLGNDSWAFSPMVTYTPVFHGGPESGDGTNLLSINARAEKSFGPFDLFLGGGYLFYFIGGGGGTVSLNNGSGTSSFGLPSKSVMTGSFFASAGMGIRFWRISVNLDGYVTDVATSRRATDFLLSASFGLF